MHITVISVAEVDRARVGGSFLATVETGESAPGATAEEASGRLVLRLAAAAGPEGLSVSVVERPLPETHRRPLTAEQAMRQALGIIGGTVKDREAVAYLDRISAAAHAGAMLGGEAAVQACLAVSALAHEAVHSRQVRPSGRPA